MTGTGRFADPHTVEVDDGERPDPPGQRGQDRDRHRYPAGRPPSVEFDERTVIDSDGIVHLKKVPRSMVVAGAGVIGIEYASMFAALGTKVTVVEQRDRMLEFCDAEVVEALKYHLRDLAVTFRFGETVFLGRGAAEGRDRDAGERQEDPGGHGHVLGRPARGKRRPRPRHWLA